MLDYVKKGQEHVFFLQVWDKEKPKIICYDSLEDFMRVSESKEEAGFGKLVTTKKPDNIVYLYGENIDQEHLREYEKYKKNIQMIIRQDVGIGSNSNE